MGIHCHIDLCIDMSTEYVVVLVVNTSAHECPSTFIIDDIHNTDDDDDDNHNDN